MKHIAFQTQKSEDISSFDTLILPVFTLGETLAQAHTWQLDSLIRDLCEQKDFVPKPGQTLLLLNQPSVKRICLVGMGDRNKLTEKTYLETCKATAAALNNSGAVRALSLISMVRPDTRDQAWSIFQFSLALQRSFYDYAHSSRGTYQGKEPTLCELVHFNDDSSFDPEPTIAQAQASAIGMALTQDLANMPSNFCTPAHLADTAKDMAKEYGFECRILERDEMTDMGMGAFMAVAQGSQTPPKMICLSYSGADASQPPIALVGKGVTFDTGGISLKPGADMDEMKFDMGGAATVLGVFKALGELKPNLNAVAVIPATENMPSAEAIKPGDVVTSLSGQTIEILNTDAEGRLILCDALTYVQRTYQPSEIIDMATLTGACIIALGHHMSAVLGNDQSLIEDLLQASRTVYDRFWQLPLSEEYDEQLKSNFADMANIGGRPAGTITAAQFLARFTKDARWAHLDIAGTAWTSGANKGASGRPVPALVEFLMRRAQG